MRPIMAYIDPSAVTYLIQAVAGVVIALGAARTIFRHKIFAVFKNKKKDADDTVDDRREFKEEDKAEDHDDDAR